MVLFIYGEDSYRCKEKLDEIVGHYKAVRKSGLNLRYINAKEEDFMDFYDQLKVASMFAETKLVILKNVFSNKSFQEDFHEKLKDLESLKDVIVIFEPEKVDQRLKLFKQLCKECKSQEFALLDAKQVKMWAQKQLQNRGAVINNDALDLLVLHVGNDLWRFSGEIEKLYSFKDGQTIRKEDVQALVKPSIVNDIFKTIDALAEKNKKQALQLLHKHLDGDDNPLYLFSMIGYQIRNLLVVKELSQKGLMYNSIVKKSGLHPFVVKKTYFQCRQFSLDQLKQMYKEMFAIDSAIKVGKVEPETALDLFVSKI